MFSPKCIVTQVFPASCLCKSSRHKVWLDHFYLLGRELIIPTSKIVEFYRYSCCGRGVIPALRLLSLRFAGDLSFWCWLRFVEVSHSCGCPMWHFCKYSEQMFCLGICSDSLYIYILSNFSLELWHSAYVYIRWVYGFKKEKKIKKSYFLLHCWGKVVESRGICEYSIDCKLVGALQDFSSLRISLWIEVWVDEKYGWLKKNNIHRDKMLPWKGIITFITLLRRVMIHKDTFESMRI
jgi:hypothetical protein